MRWNVVELANNGRYAKLHRGFLVVMEGDAELGRVIIDEMNCLLLTAEQTTLSKPVMVRLAEHGVPIVVCGLNYHPISIVLPYGLHHQTTRVLQDQIAASKPLKKRLWQAIVKCKIRHQRQVLVYACPSQAAAAKRLARIHDDVRSGDSENAEAQAARVYWQALMGSDFRRRTQGGDGANIALNYGYSIVRAACARAIVAAGLLPTLGLYHRNQNNPFCLADDLMEVYRPLVDQCVFAMGNRQDDELNSEHKRQLAKLLQTSITVKGEGTTVNTSMQTLAISLARSLESKRSELALPELETQGRLMFGMPSD